MKCIHCGKGIHNGVALFRQNPKGEPGIWACGACNTKPVDPEVKEIVEAIAATGGKCPDGLTPDGPNCPRCGGKRGESGVDGGSWVHIGGTK